MVEAPTEKKEEPGQEQLVELLKKDAFGLRMYRCNVSLAHVTSNSRWCFARRLRPS